MEITNETQEKYARASKFLWSILLLPIVYTIIVVAIIGVFLPNTLIERTQTTCVPLSASQPDHAK